jgi:magnesium chelatase subunit D
MTTLAAPRQDAGSDAMRACLALAIDPHGLGGAMLRGRDNPARYSWIEDLRRCMVAGATFRKLPPYVSTDRLLGGIDVAATLGAERPVFERGLLAEADGGVLVLTSSERIPPDTAAVVAGVLETGEVAAGRGGNTASRPARFAVIACDEGDSEDEHTPVVLADRLAFHLEFQELDPLDRDMVDRLPTSRENLSRVVLPEKVISALCQTALALGIRSLRPVIFAALTARAFCALAGRATVTDEDAGEAARLVLAPRAVTFPVADQEDQAPAEDNSSPEPQSDSEQANVTPSELPEMILEAIKAALPAGLLAGLDRGLENRLAKRSGAGAQANKAGTQRGRPAGTRKGELKAGARLNLIETLRAAVPWQRLRNAASPGHPGVKVRREDFRINRFKKRKETTAIFVVDASGSAALHRLAEAKGAVELILAECYVRRDKIALVAFRGRKAEVLLPPTRSLQRAKRSLAELPGGGGTPLCAGIESGAMIADQVRRGGGVPLLVFLTDGRANIARDGTADRTQATKDARDAGRALRAQGCNSLLIDVSVAPGEAGKQIAEAMAASYLPLPHADSTAISRSVSAAMKQQGAA